MNKSTTLIKWLIAGLIILYLIGCQKEYQAGESDSEWRTRDDCCDCRGIK